MGFQKLRLRLLQSIFVKRTNAQLHAVGHEQLEKRSRQSNHVPQSCINQIGRSSEHQFGDDMIATTHTDAGLLRYPRDIDRNVAGGIATSDNKHALVLENVGPPVSGRMQHFPGKASAILWHQRFAMVSAANDEIVESLLLCAVRSNRANAPS